MPALRRPAAAALALFSLTFPACPPAAHAEDGAEGHGRTGLDEIIVTASPLGQRQFDVLQGTASLSGERLDRALGLSLGDTVGRLPGVAQTGYTSGASRPVIRGLGGDRIRVLVDGIGSFDAATASPDHAPAVDVATARRIEVVRGPATLLYGSNAAGGVVNVIDGRIPAELPPAKDGGLRYEGFARFQYGANARERGGSAGLTAALPGTPLALHVDGSIRRTGDMAVPGFARSGALRAAEPVSEGTEEPRHRLDNSDVRDDSVTGGVSWVGGFGHVGASVTRQTSNYGIPVNTEEPGEPPATRIDLAQTRADLSGELDAPFLVFETARLRVGYGDYVHRELDDGAVGTRFLNNQWEGRAELVQRQIGRLTGALGVQASHRNFRVIGDEAVVPPSLTDQFGFFTVQKLDLGAVALEAGLRVEHQDLTARTVAYDRGFTTVSGSAGAGWTFAPDWLAGISLYRTERAPTAEEVLADGPHAATFTFQQGDRVLGKEVATGLEATLRRSAGPLTGSLSAYYTHYDDFISEQRTGEVEDGLAVTRFGATDARFWGLEAEATLLAWARDDRHLHLDLQADYVHAQDTGGDQPLPRIPPLRLTAGVEYEQTEVSGRVEVQWARRQDRAGLFELPTDGYASLNASIDWHPLADRDLTLTLQGRNLTDSTIRYATSFLKDRLPAAGREVRLGARVAF